MAWILIDNTTSQQCISQQVTFNLILQPVLFRVPIKRLQYEASVNENPSNFALD